MKKEISEEEYKELLIQMLKDFHVFCKDNNIKYYAGYGTLLGAVRHQGFIPWDDDLDVVMLRADYNKFLILARKWQSIYRVKSFEDDDKYPYNFAKIYDTRTVLTENLWNKYEMGVYIDIFPIDAWPQDDEIIRKIRSIQKYVKIKAYRIGSIQGIKKNIALCGLKPIFSFLKLNNLICKIECIVNECSKIDGYVGNVAANNYGIKEKMERNWFEGQILLPFENTYISAPKKYDNILHQLYGDYMTPPPEDDQKTHHTYLAWWRE